MRFIAVTGRAKHGKNFFAESLVDIFTNRGITSKIFTISDTVFQECKDLGILTCPTRDDCTPADLTKLVAHGHSKRAVHPLYWIHATEARIRESAIEFAVIPGIRFHNEVEWCRSFEGIVIKLVRLEQFSNKMWLSTDRDPNDPMESTVDEIVADYDFYSRSGQQDFITCQALAFANFLSGQFKPVILRDYDWYKSNDVLNRRP